MSGDLFIGEVIYIAVKPIFKIYMIIGVGFYLSRKNILTIDTSKNISAIAIRILIPCLAFQKIVSNINNTMIHEIATIIIISYFMMFSQALIIFLVGVCVGCPRNWWGGLICCGLLPNISDLPIAYLQTMETADVFENVDLGVSFIMIYMSLQLILQFTLGSYKLIEHDFAVDGKADNDEAVNIKDNQPEGLMTNSSTNSFQKDNDEFQLPIHNNNELHSIDSELSISTTANINRFQNMVHNTSNLIKSVTNNTTLSRHISRLDVPSNILNNSRINSPPEDIDDIVKVYSRYDELKKESSLQVIASNITTNDKIIKSFQSISWKNLFWTMVDVWKDSLTQPVSIIIVVSIAFAMIPWVQALFVFSPQVTLPNAPDKQPPLSFIMDFAGYIGAAQVPFGLLLLGGTIGRLRAKSIPKRLWVVPIIVTFLRLFIFPIIGCAFNSKIYSDGLFYDQDVLYFISNINFCLPPATSILYITAFYTPNDGENHIQMDMLALVYIFHYIFLIICLPFTATYTMKVSLKF